MGRKRYTTWEEYNQLSDKEKDHVKVVSFTGLTDCDTLGVEQSAGGSSAPSDPPEDRSKK